MKTKTKKQKAKFHSTMDLVRALPVCSEHITLDDLSDYKKLIISSLINDAADRIMALVALTAKQSKQINELEESLRKAAK